MTREVKQMCIVLPPSSVFVQLQTSDTQKDFLGKCDRPVCTKKYFLLNSKTPKYVLYKPNNSCMDLKPFTSLYLNLYKYEIFTSAQNVQRIKLYALKQVELIGNLDKNCTSVNRFVQDP